MIKYMHTIKGVPAFYLPKNQICYVGPSTDPAMILVNNWEEFKQQQELSRKYREEMRWPLDTNDYGYLKVIV